MSTLNEIAKSIVEDYNKNYSRTTINDIANKIGMTKSAVSHQLAYLKNLRLIKSRKEGKEVYYSLDDDHVNLLINSAWEHVTE